MHTYTILQHATTHSVCTSAVTRKTAQIVHCFHSKGPSCRHVTHKYKDLTETLYCVSIT